MEQQEAGAVEGQCRCRQDSATLCRDIPCCLWAELEPCTEWPREVLLLQEHPGH